MIGVDKAIAARFSFPMRCFRGVLGFFLFSSFLGSLFAQSVEEEPRFNLGAGTSAPCPSPDQYSRERPDPPGVVTRVGVGLSFVDILEIRDTEQTFVTDVWMALRWKDSRLADPSRGEAYADCQLPTGDVWIPRLQFRNLRDVKSDYSEITLIDAQGYIHYFSRKLITFYTPLDLRDFPFDRQVLTVTADSILTTNEVKLEVLDAFSGLRGQSVTSWTLGNPKSSINEEYAAVRGANYSSYTSQLEAEREPGYFRRKLLIPVTLIVFMSWAIFWIKPSMTAPQMAVGTTSMLTLIAYQFALSGFLPRISYLTRADTFMLWSLVLVFTALMEAVATAALVNFGKEEQVLKMDRIFRVAYPVALALVLAVAML